MFSNRLKELRRKKGLTQGALAEKLGISSSTVSMYERGERRPDTATLKKICRFFSVSADILLDDLPENREIEDVIEEFRERMLAAEGLMFNGVPLTEQDIEKLTDAITISANVVLHRKS